MGRRGPLTKLSESHRRFIAHYVARPHNAAAAYIAAGYSAGGAKQSAHELLKEPLVQAEVKRMIEEKHRQLHMDVDEILARAAMLARVDAAALYDEEGHLKPVHELDQTASIAIAGLEIEETVTTQGEESTRVTRTKKVRLRDPMAAIRLLAEHKKLVRNADEGVNALASAIADRLKAARDKRKAKEK